MADDPVDLRAACARGGRFLDDAMRRLRQHYGAMLLREARAALGASEAVHDLVQQALIKAWRACATYQGLGLATWLRRILRNTVIDHLRAHHPEVPWVDDQGQLLAEVDQALLAAAAGTPVDPEGLALQDERFRVYQACFARFAAEDPLAAETLRWSVEDDLTIDELAALLQRTPAATRQYLSQCRKKARRHLAPWYLMLRA